MGRDTEENKALAMWLWGIDRGYTGEQGSANVVMEHRRRGREGAWIVKLSCGTQQTRQCGEHGSGNGERYTRKGY